MGKITVSINNQNKTQKVKKSNSKEKIILTYYPLQKEVPERYTYLEDGKEVEFTDSSYIITKISSTKSLAKKSIVEKVQLQFQPEKDHVEYQDGYFTYKDSDERFLDDVVFDKEVNSYIGTITKVHTYDKEIQIFEE